MMLVKKMMIILFLTVMTLGCGVSFLTTSESTPSVVVMEKSMTLEMMRLENDWWTAEVSLEQRNRVSPMKETMKNLTRMKGKCL